MSVLKRYIIILKRRAVYSAVLAVTFAVGIVCGLLLPVDSERMLVSDSVVNFMLGALSRRSSPARLFLSESFADAFCFALFFITSFTYFTLPVHFFVVGYRGYIVGAAALAFIKCFGVTGITVFVFSVLVKSVLTVTGLIIFSTLARDALSRAKNCKNETFGDIVRALIIGFAVSFTGLILQMVLLVFVLRPLNFNF